MLEPDASDLPDRYARDVDGLPLAGNHGLRGRELGVDRVEALADERHPRRELEPLVAEYVAGDGQRDQHQRYQRDELAGVLADREAHGPGPVCAELRFGSLFL